MKKMVIDCLTVKDREQFHDMFAQALEFPDYYGRNLDALFDCLTDIHQETDITLISHGALEANMGLYGKKAVEVLLRAAMENENITLSLE